MQKPDGRNRHRMIGSPTGQPLAPWEELSNQQDMRPIHASIHDSIHGSIHASIHELIQ